MTVASVERSIAFEDGATTIVESWGDGPAILCIHGIASSRKSWERFGRHFAGRFRTYAYDQRGHGDAMHGHARMALARFVEDARSVAASIDTPVVAIVGHSWGGAVAILAGREIGDARAVVAVDPMLFVVPGTWERDYLDDVAADLALDRVAREQALRARLGAWNELDILGKLHAMRVMQAHSIAALGRDNHVDQGGWNLRACVLDYPKPLLIAAAGPDDSVMSAEDVALLRRAGPNITIAPFADQGHNLHRTAFERFAGEVELFLAPFLNEGVA